jgi:hypothetical protein
VPKVTPQKISELKRLDPIFAKRYKQLITAKNTNRAPKFDLNDYYASMAILKGSKALTKKREEIVTLANNVQVNKPKTFKIEMEKAEAKVKYYVQNLCDFL